MMPEEWPIAAVAADRSVPAQAAGRGRLATVRADFFLDPRHRLSEQERALMAAMLHCLVGEVADALRAALPAGWGAANDESNLALVESLSRRGLLDDPALMALLVRRADEERIGASGRARSGRRDARTIQGLVSNEDGAVSAAAMALILARGRRRDRFGQCLLLFDDLPPELAESVANIICAGLRAGLEPVQGAGAADSALLTASRSVLAGHDPSRSVEAATAALVAALDAGRSLEPLILAAAHEGELAFIAQVAATRAGLGGTAAIDELLSGDVRRVMALLRMAGLPREHAAAILAAIGDLLGIDDAARAIALFDQLSEPEVAEARAWLASPPAYRAAVEALDRNRG
jgi:hypothetical protein